MDRLVGARPRALLVFSMALAFGGGAGAAGLDDAVITVSGSTNTQPYTISVSSDGSATVMVAGASTAKHVTVPAAATARFFADLQAARKGNAASVPCMKSVSFGTTTHVTWQGWVSPDLDCPPKDDLGSALVADVEAIRTAAGMTGPPMRGGPAQMPQGPVPETTPRE